MADGDGAAGGVRPRKARVAGRRAIRDGRGRASLDTAQARSINAQTAMQWNDYVAQVSLESARMHQMRVHSEFQKNQSLYDAHQRRLRDSPGKFEIENGDALNAALDDMTNPKLGSSALHGQDAGLGETDRRGPLPEQRRAGYPHAGRPPRGRRWQEVFDGGVRHR